MKIAHTKEHSDEVQTIAAHSLATAESAAAFAIEPLKPLLYQMGLLHDVGKYQLSFQRKLLRNNSLRVEHAACGAIEARRLWRGVSSLIAQYCIMGHHTGIPDGGNRANEPTTLHGRLAHPERLEDYADYAAELPVGGVDDEPLRGLLSGAATREEMLERFAFLTRYCFSCLTDADSLDTARFCTGREDTELKSDFRACLDKLDRRLASFTCVTQLQRARAVLQRQVFERAEDDAEIYLMNMPTGSGKTLCSMKLALMRALKTGKRRIIYVIPYNSIIDQTVAELEGIFGESAAILRHQSSFCADDTDADEDYRQLLKQVTENWNAQLIVTTSVQFFESLYGNKRGRLRKLHNMADSVIVFDEAHLMPVGYLQPCLRAVAYLTRLLNSEAVFLTATMPDFPALMRQYALPDSRVAELVTDKSAFSAFRKGEYVNLGAVEEDALLADACAEPASLIVVNNRATAARLYNAAAGRKYHLSTYMAACDRKRVIDEIKAALAQLYADYPDPSAAPDERRILVVSTSLIEAGVDLDFYAVYRELNGLDSILQAGGRCNREGKRQGAKIRIFDLGRPSADARVNITKGLVSQYGDISSPACIDAYYRAVYRFHDEAIKRNSIVQGCAAPDSLPFAAYADGFHMIDGNTVAVAVERDAQSARLIDELKTNGYTDYRKLQKYTFTVYETELDDLARQGAAQEFGGVWCLTNPDYYNGDTGVSFTARDLYI